MNEKLKNYAILMRFDKPIGIYLLLWPTLWGLWLAGHGHPDSKICIIFVLGVIVMRACGCVINDLADRDFDPHVARTKTRPIAAGKVSVSEALLLVCLMALIAFGLAFTLNALSLQVAAFAMAITVVYPFCKRFISTPQLVLGVAFSLGIPMAYAALNDTMVGFPWLFFMAAVLWPVAYDTMYAMADREDDLKVGVKSTAILFGHYDRLIVGLIQVTILVIFVLFGMIQQMQYPYYIGLLGASSLALYQQYLIRAREPNACFKAFLNNHWFGAVIFLGIFLQYWVQT